MRKLKYIAKRNFVAQTMMGEDVYIGMGQVLDGHYLGKMKGSKYLAHQINLPNKRASIYDERVVKQYFNIVEQL